VAWCYGDWTRFDEGGPRPVSDDKTQFITFSDDSDPELVLGRYKLEHSLGSGGMGDVFFATDMRLPRKVAIKKVKEALSHDEMVRKRIERECALHAAVGTHPNIVTLHDVIDVDGVLHIVLEFVEGVTLDRWLKDLSARGSRVPRNEAVTIVAQVLEALSAIHAHNIVHRDIKPANIMVTHNQRTGDVSAKLMDFGIAKEDDDSATQLTATTGTGPGTPYYMAPEQIDPATFGAVTAATDLYAVGIVMYQMISGKPPFTGTLTEVFNKHLNEQPPALEIAQGYEDCQDLQPIIQTAIAKQPGSRYQSAHVMRNAVLGIGHAGDTQDAKTRPAGMSPETAATLPAGAAVTQTAVTAANASSPETAQRLHAGTGGGAGHTQWAGDAAVSPGGSWAKRIAAAVVAVLIISGIGVFGVSVMNGASTQAAEDPADAEVTQTVEEPAPNTMPGVSTDPVIEFAGVGKDPGIENKTGQDAFSLVQQRLEQKASESDTAPASTAAQTVTTPEPMPAAAETKPAETAQQPEPAKPKAALKKDPKDIGKEGDSVKVGERRWVEQ
jgi:eukaryotic-like serine/threonine-protein kinase